ncbi:MAG: alpha/beta hydrolase [Methylocystis sp.]|nr:alpha/beta hydrolase [Methylocystis sp.]
MGESLGTGIATVIAAAHPAAALVLDSPFSSLVEVAAAHYPIFPVRSLMLDRFQSDLAIGDVRMPLLVVHGDRDPVVPIRFGRQLFERANEPKTFMSVRGGGHLVLGLADVLGRVQDWIDAATAANRR